MVNGWTDGRFGGDAFALTLFFRGFRVRGSLRIWKGIRGGSEWCGFLLRFAMAAFCLGGLSGLVWWRLDKVTQKVTTGGKGVRWAARPKQGTGERLW